MTVINHLCALLDRLYEWNPIVGYLVALTIAAVCTLVLARLNADGTSVAAFVTRPA